MKHRAKQPSNRQLSDEADRYLAEIVNYSTPEMSIRECSFHRDLRPLRIISDFEETLERKHRAGRMGANDYAIAASFYRDVRVYAVSKGLFDLFRVAFCRENRFRRRMLLAEPRWGDKCLGVLYTLWGLTSRYGTSLLQWLLSGAAIIVLFALALTYVGQEPLNISSAFLCSIETFLQAAYEVESAAVALRSTLLAERLVGMVYLVFGFSLLLPKLSLEFARTTPSTSNPSVSRGQLDKECAE